PRLQQSPRQQAALAEFSAVRGAQVGRFVVQGEDLHEVGPREPQGFADGRVVVANDFRPGGAFEVTGPHGLQQAFAPRLPNVAHVVGPRQPAGAAAGVGQVDVAVVRSQKTRAAGDVGIADQYVGRGTLGDGPALVSHDRADRWVDHRARGGSTGVHAVRGGGVLVDDFVVHAADEVEAVENVG